ncbi:replication initiation protein [Ectothiorhodospira lacustris]|uniref:replication initiation protein n=1 Tax=Ectothiorhodospira lacustris TaxID=2899127 RepID=UPI001EE94D43|nr:replication initiation protein [Ectothiorhodospira lacustris]MCG5511490.1 replication initiation protein [Ectothiorhodospira lacustris]MCG5523277.1 replication initiation protein [Ectothiorhodospira lacustris]
MNQQLQSLPIYKSNALVEASYRLTPAEQRIVLAAIARVRRDEPITDEVLYSVNVADYSDLVGTESHSVYKELADAALRLKRREVWIKQEPNGKGKRPRTLITGWVQSIVYIESEGRVELRFTKDMLPYLTQLSTNFTRYALADVAKMTSAHAIRLYELLCQWREAGEREVSIDWLREAFQLDGKYPAIKDFKKRVIEPAVEQINECSPLFVKWDQRKTGRRVTHLVFMFGEKPKSKSKKKSQKKTAPATQPTEKKNPGFTDEEIAKAARPGETWEQARQRLEEERRRRIEAARSSARSVVGLARHE